MVIEKICSLCNGDEGGVKYSTNIGYRKKNYLQNAPRYTILTRSIFQTQSATLQKSNTTFFFRFADLALSGHDHVSHVSLCNVLTWG